jgi:hypothetical protein
LLTSSIAIRVAFLTATSLIAIVPLSEFSTPTLMPAAVPVVAAGAAAGGVVGLAAGGVVGLAAGAGALQAARSPATDTPSTAPVDAISNWRRLSDRLNIRQP